MKPKPIKVKHGEKIDTPGLYEMPISWHHDDTCIGPSISSSGLRKIDLYSPAHYWDGSPFNPKRNLEKEAETAEKSYIRLGRAAHLLVLEPQRFKAGVITRPDRWDSWRSKDAKIWRAARILEGVTVLDPKEYEKVIGIAAALRAHPVHREGILDGLIEISIIWRDGKTGIWLKARPDAIPMSANMLVDLKVTTDARPKACWYKVRDLGYDMQMALTGVGMQRVLGRTIEHNNLIFVEDESPHVLRNAPLTDSMIYWARLRCRRAIDIFATCLRQKDWPGYVETDGQHIDTSDEEQKRYQAELESGLLPKEF